MKLVTFTYKGISSAVNCYQVVSIFHTDHNNLAIGLTNNDVLLIDNLTFEEVIDILTKEEKQISQFD